MKPDIRHSYFFYGCRLRSEIPLSLLPVAADDAAPDVTLILGKVPESVSDAVWSSPFVSISRTGSVVLRVEDAGRILVESGHTITVQLSPGATRVEIEAFLTGPVAGILLHQRGVLPLHASCVDAGGAIALCGSVARGKSTLAAMLVRRGGTLVADDVSAITFGEDSIPVVAPGSAGLRLWPDSREQLRYDERDWQPIRPDHLKRVGPAAVLPEGPYPVRALVRLVIDNASNRPSIQRIRGPLSIARLSGLVYRIAIGRALQRGESLFRDVTRLADKVPVFELRRPAGLDHLAEMADLVLAAAGGSI